MYERRELTYRYDEDGCLVIRAKLPAEQGELILRALERAMGSATANEDVSAETSPTKTPAAHLENGPQVSAETSARIACDCCVRTIDESATGEPLNIGRRSRTIPPPMRRALSARDGGCRFPGCTSHRYCDGHHIEHWQNGGETSLDNLVLLCRDHYRLVHEGGFDCRKSEGGRVCFTDQRERRLAEYERPAPKSVEATLTLMYRRFDRHRLDGDACAARWHAGDTTDRDHARFAAFQPTGPG